MEKEEKIEVEGKVVDAVRNGFLVEIASGQTVQAVVSGKMRMKRIMVLPGDQVTIELSPYDLTKGRITYRHK